MATLPAEGRWSLRLLSDDDFKGALEFLQRDPLINVYLISRLLEERTLAATQIAVVRYNGVIVLVASLATNIVLAGDPSVSRDITHRRPHPHAHAAGARDHLAGGAGGIAVEHRPHAHRSADGGADEPADLRIEETR